MNNYGTILKDLQKPFLFRTQLFQFEHPDQCMQFTTNLIQPNRFDAVRPSRELTDIESDLRLLNTKLSRLPEDRYPDKNSCFSRNLNLTPNNKECENKIIYHQK